MDRELFLIQFSILAIPFTAISLFILSVIELIQHFQMSWILLLPIMGIVLSIHSVRYEFMTLGACDGLNVPHAVPIRTRNFLFLSVLNMMCIILIAFVIA